MKNKNMLLMMTLSFFLCGFAGAQAQTPQSDCDQAKTQLATAQRRLADWPALSRYAGANAQVAAPARSEARVVFMGDSITDSWDDPKYGGFFPGKPYLNRGISGQTTPQMLIRFRPDVIALRPAAVVILAGTNDLAGNTGLTSLEAIQGNLVSMCELASANRIKVVLASVLPVSDYDLRDDGKPIVRTIQRPPEKILALNAWLKQYAAKNKLVYLDYHSAMIDEKGFLKDELSDDGLHPNTKGYEVMAPLVEQSIFKALGMRK